MLQVRNIDVYYKDLHVLKNVSIEVKKNEILVLVGTNGAGKSTTIKTISSLLTPKNGSILFNGKRIDTMACNKIIEMGIVHVPEGRRLFPEMSVEENLIMGSLAKKAKMKRYETLDYVFSLFPRLKERRKQMAGTLSGGEQQMAAIGRGLMSLPKLMMLDEPSLGLAPIMVTEVFELIKQINKKGVTILLVEQNVMQTLTMCSRAYVMENGNIIRKGTGKELLNDKKIKEAFLGI